MKNIEKNLIGFALIGIIITIYSLFNNEQLSDKDLIRIDGTIKDAPFYGSHGGDMKYEYIRFELNGYNSNYYVRNDAYHVLKLNEFKKLRAGDTIQIGFVNQLKTKISIYELYSGKYGYILKLDDYNKRVQKSWKYPLFVTIGIFGLFLFRLGKRLLS